MIQKIEIYGINQEQTGHILLETLTRQEKETEEQFLWRAQKATVAWLWEQRKNHKIGGWVYAFGVDSEIGYLDGQFQFVDEFSGDLVPAYLVEIEG